jgi:lipopolysaccharide export system protein LptA
MTQGDRIVTGNEATYLHDAQRVIVRGNAVLKEGKNVVKGRQVIVFLEENRGVVEGNPSEQVSATIFPSEKSKK